MYTAHSVMEAAQLFILISSQCLGFFKFSTLFPGVTILSDDFYFICMQITFRSSAHIPIDHPPASWAILLELSLSGNCQRPIHKFTCHLFSSRLFLLCFPFNKHKTWCYLNQFIQLQLPTHSDSPCPPLSYTVTWMLSVAIAHGYTKIIKEQFWWYQQAICASGQTVSIQEHHHGVESRKLL